jgi:hypothetical protein
MGRLMPQIDAGETGASSRAEINRILGLSIRTVSGASYTIVADDHERLLLFTNIAPVTVTVPSGLPTDFICHLAQMGSGSVTMAVSGGTIVRSFGGVLVLAGRYAKAELYCTALNQYLLNR